MVVDYVRKEGLVVGARPFHAVLLAGEAALPSPVNDKVEQFLRVAEPPAHDCWDYTDDLRDNYEKGAKARLEDFKQAIGTVLKKHIRAPAAEEEQGPEALRRLLMLGKVTESESLATLRNVNARMQGEAWRVSAEIVMAEREKNAGPVRLAPYVAIEAESGGALRLGWKSLKPSGGGTARDGDMFVIPATTRRFTFDGVTDEPAISISPARCFARLGLQFGGETAGVSDAE